MGVLRAAGANPVAVVESTGPGSKSVDDFDADLVAAAAGRGAEQSVEIGGRNVQSFFESLNGTENDPGCDSPPAAVNGCRAPSFPVDENHRNTVGRDDRDSHVSPVGHERIAVAEKALRVAGRSLRGANGAFRNENDAVSVHLLQAHDGGHSKLRREKLGCSGPPPLPAGVTSRERSSSSFEDEVE